MPGLRLSNRDCACLRLSQSFRGGILPVMGYPAFHTRLMWEAEWARVLGVKGESLAGHLCYFIHT